MMAYQSPAAAPPHFMGALMGGMVILMIPAFLICLGITVFAYRRRKQWADTDVQGESAPSFDVVTDAGDEPWR